jgi:malate dehydrogenase (oxaloacetate-decarboxylating)(NADP+)
MKDADVFLGLSVGNVVTPEMIKSMAKNPVVFALANPDPEITYELAIEARKDVIVATGRSDKPNQVNNVLGFPYIFRGALDVRATTINEAMKLAAVKALAQLTKTHVPEIVNMAYNEKNISFGPQYIIPKPLDPRLLSTVAPAVAKAAMESGVARINIDNWEGYAVELNKRLGLDNQLFRVMGIKARKDPRYVIFAEGDSLKVIKAAQICYEEGICYPILLGDEQVIQQLANENSLDIEDLVIVNPKDQSQAAKREKYGEQFFAMRGRKGYNRYEAIKAMKDRVHFACMMLKNGEADAVISGPSRDYSGRLRPALQIIGTENGINKVAGMYILLTKKGPLFLADATVNLNPNANEIADIAQLVARELRHFNMKPKIALLSYSNFGSSNTKEAQMMAEARTILKQRDPELIVDGEIQGILAFNNEILKENYPFSELIDQDVNTLIFPNLSSGNIAYNLLREVGGADAIGPVLMGMDKPVHVLQLGSSVRNIINMTLIAVLDAQQKNKEKPEQKEEQRRRWWKKRKKTAETDHNLQTAFNR